MMTKNELDLFTDFLDDERIEYKINQEYIIGKVSPIYTVKTDQGSFDTYEEAQSFINSIKEKK